MHVEDWAALAAERDRFRELYEQERADRQIVQDLYRHALLTIETQKELLRGTGYENPGPA